jgi:hypothetical protein
MLAVNATVYASPEFKWGTGIGPSESFAQHEAVSDAAYQCRSRDVRRITEWNINTRRYVCTPCNVRGVCSWCTDYTAQAKFACE